MSLSIREKILLFLLGLAVILFVGIKYLVSPAVQSDEADKARLETLFEQQSTAQQKIGAMGSASSNLKKDLTNADSAASSILPEPQNELLNVWIVDLVNKSGLHATLVTFSAATATDIGPQTSQNAAGGTTTSQPVTPDYLLKDYADGYKGNAAPKTPAASGSGAASSSSSSAKQAAGTEGGLLSVSITLNMTGTYDQAKAFLDDVNNCGKTAIVTSFDCSVSGGVYTIDAVVQCYGAEKPDNNYGFVWELPKPAGSGSVM